MNKFNITQIPFITGDELLQKPMDNMPSLVIPILQKVGLACIAGCSDSGKSSFLRHLCMNIVANETDFVGFTITAEQKSAIYVSTEDDKTAMQYLMQKQNRDLQRKSTDLKKLRFLFDTSNLLESLDTMMTEQPVDIVCIDAFTDLYEKPMNESNQIRSFLNDYSQLAQKHQCLILFLHHCAKRSETNAPSKNNLLGSQAIEAKMRLVMELRNDPAIADIKHLCIVKGNYLPALAKQESYKLRFTENMTFENTGERVLLENLRQISDDGYQKYLQIIKFQEQGFTQQQITEKLGYTNKSSISKLIKQFDKKNTVEKRPRRR